MTEVIPPYVWLLNPGAEQELEHARILSPGTYTPTLPLLRAIAKKRELFLTLTETDPVLFLHEARKVGRKAQQKALLWCKTPSAVTRARALGYAVGESPSWDCLQTVHDKAVLHQEGLRCLPGRVAIHSLAEWDQKSPALRGPAPPFETCALVRAKRSYGFAARGQRTLPEQLSSDDQRWLTDSLRQGPLVLEPEIVQPCLASQHGLLTASGLILGDLVMSAPDQVRADTATTAQDSAQQQCTLAADFLGRSGYFGPFGLDLVLGDDGLAYALDLNPRFTLAWSRGMGKRRAECLLEILSEPDLHSSKGT